MAKSNEPPLGGFFHTPNASGYLVGVEAGAKITVSENPQSLYEVTKENAATLLEQGILSASPPKPQATVEEKGKEKEVTTDG